MFPLKLLRQYRRILSMSLAALWAYKLRAVFVILAVGLGIASLAIIVAAVDGAQRRAVEITQWFGPDAALVFGGNFRSRAVGQRTMTLTREDVTRLRQSLPGAYLVVPMQSISDAVVRAGNRNMRVARIIGSTEDYAEAWNWPLVEGRDLSLEDIETSAKVCLIGDSPAQELFGDASPIGKTIFVRDLPVQIVGRLSYRGFSGGETAVDERIILPMSTLTQRFNLDRKYYRAMRIKFYEPQLMAEHKENLRSYLRHLHGLRPEQDDDFSVITADEVLKFLSMLKGSLVVFLGITAGVAMIVGGFVLANLFYLSVSERRTEIGLKKAMGAPSWAILAQFLIEATALTIIGAAVGLGLGLGFGKLLNNLGILPIQYSPKIFILAFASSSAIGILFGLKPARQAAGLHPIDALRGNG